MRKGALLLLGAGLLFGAGFFFGAHALHPAPPTAAVEDCPSESSNALRRLVILQQQQIAELRGEGATLRDLLQESSDVEVAPAAALSRATPPEGEKDSEATSPPKVARQRAFLKEVASAMIDTLFEDAGLETWQSEAAREVLLAHQEEVFALDDECAAAGSQCDEYVELQEELRHELGQIFDEQAAEDYAEFGKILTGRFPRQLLRQPAKNSRLRLSP